MSTYAVSFTIDYDATYVERYDSLMSEIRASGKIWAETTSFCLVDSNETLENLERRLFLSRFSPTRDKMLVVDVSLDRAIARGAIEYPATLRSLLPLVEIKSAVTSHG